MKICFNYRQDISKKIIIDSEQHSFCKRAKIFTKNYEVKWFNTI